MKPDVMLAEHAVIGACARHKQLTASWATALKLALARHLRFGQVQERSDKTVEQLLANALTMRKPCRTSKSNTSTY